MDSFPLFRLFKAKLSRQIVFWIFASLMIIEGVLLIPSVERRERELLDRVKQLSALKMSWLTMTFNHVQSVELLDELEHLKEDSESATLVGYSAYDLQGNVLRHYGEKPDLKWNDLNSKKDDEIFEVNWRYDIAYSLPLFKLVIILRYDVSSIQHDLSAYQLRILGLIVIIVFFITSITLIVLDLTVINPILKLRQDLLKAGEILSKKPLDMEKIAHFDSCHLNRKDEIGEMFLAFNQMFDRIAWEIGERLKTAEKLRHEQQKTDKLLLNIIPEAIVDRLKQEEDCIADHFQEVSILFADIVGFTELSATIPPSALVNLLNQVFSRFDLLSEKHELEKIKTIGDAYMVASGLPYPRQDHAIAIANMALEMLVEIEKLNQQNDTALSIRIGINTGSVVAGVIGKKKFIYDLWGDAVNTASRMESHGLPGTIQVTPETYFLLKNDYIFEERGLIFIKGKGEMLTYLLKQKKH